MISKGSLLPARSLLARRDRLASTMLGEAVILMGPPGPHCELLVCKRLQSGILPGRRWNELMREH